MPLNCAYHSSGATKVVEDEEHRQLLDTGIWFDNPVSAYEHKYLFTQEHEILQIEKGAHRKPLIIPPY